MIDVMGESMYGGSEWQGWAEANPFELPIVGEAQP